MSWYKRLLKIAAAKNKINALGIVNPSLKFFVHRYEDMVGKEWENIKSSQDLQTYIFKILLPSLKEKIDPSSNKSNYLKPQHVDIPQEYQLNPQDPIVQQAYNTYRRDPERANKAFLEHLNYDKKNAFEQWWKYLTDEEPYKNNPAFIYSILKPIIDSSPEDTKAGPPPLNSESLATIWDEITKNNVTQMNVLKQYRKISSELDKKGVQRIGTSGNNEWIKIPSKISDPDNYPTNLGKLQRFSQGTGWCIAREYHSDLYLSKGDFWLYLVEGRPMVAIRMIGNKVEEIRGHNNDETKLEPFWQEVISFLHKTNFDYQNNDHYKKLEEIYLMNANLEKASPDYNVVMEKIKQDHTTYLKLSNENRRKFPEFLEVAKHGYAAELDEHLIKIETPGLNENEYMRVFEGFQDYYKSLPLEIKTELGNMQPRIIDAHKKAFYNNPIVLTEFPPEIQRLFSNKDQLSAWKNYIDQDPYHYNDKRIPSEVRQNLSPEFLKEEWDKLLTINSEHVDHIPPELKKLWRPGEIEQYILRDFSKYPVSRAFGRFNKLERVEKLVRDKKIQRSQMINALINAIKINPEWMAVLPKNYQDEILAVSGDIKNIVNKEQSSHVIRDIGYFKSLEPKKQEALLLRYGPAIGEAFDREKSKYYGMLHDFWISIPEIVRPYLPDNTIAEVAQYYADLLNRDPSNFDNIFSKIPPDIQPIVFSKMASMNNWYRKLIKI
jgi:hypothetical protein